MAHQLTRRCTPRTQQRASAAPLPAVDFLADDRRGSEAEEKWPLPLCVLFIAGSNLVLWALIFGGVLWLVG